MGQQKSSRRDIFRFLGVGALAVPIINGMPSTEPVRLVSPASVAPLELIDQQSGKQFFDQVFEAEHEVVVYFKNKTTQSTYRMRASAFATEVNIQPKLFHGHLDAYELKLVVTGDTPELCQWK